MRIPYVWRLVASGGVLCNSAIMLINVWVAGSLGCCSGGESMCIFVSIVYFWLCNFVQRVSGAEVPSGEEACTDQHNHDG